MISLLNIGFNADGAPVRQVRLLEFNRPAHSPWLTVPLAEEEIVIQDVNEAEVFRFDYNEAMEYAREMGLPTEFPL